MWMNLCLGKLKATSFFHFYNSSILNTNFKQFFNHKCYQEILCNKGTFNNYVTVRGWVGLVVFRDAA